MRVLLLMQLRMTEEQRERFEAYVDASCWSLWEGCACGLLKEHEGLHVCACVTCHCTWNDEQADAWEVELHSDIAKWRQARALQELTEETEKLGLYDD